MCVMKWSGVKCLHHQLACRGVWFQKWWKDALVLLLLFCWGAVCRRLVSLCGVNVNSLIWHLGFRRQFLILIVLIIDMWGVNLLQDERNVKWILIISVLMVLPSILMGFYVYPWYSYPPRQPTTLDYVWLFISRIGTLAFIVTITTATLATTGFARKDLMYKASVYLFVVSMLLLFVSLIKVLFTFPSTS